MEANATAAQRLLAGEDRTLQCTSAANPKIYGVGQGVTMEESSGCGEAAGQDSEKAKENTCL